MAFRDLGDRRSATTLDMTREYPPSEPVRAVRGKDGRLHLVFTGPKDFIPVPSMGIRRWNPEDEAR